MVRACEGGGDEGEEWGRKRSLHNNKPVGMFSPVDQLSLK